MRDRRGAARVRGQRARPVEVAAVKITVVGLGKIGLPLAVQFAGPRAPRRRRRRRRARRPRRARGPPAVPRRGRARRAAGRRGRRRARWRRPPTPRRPCRRATRWSSSCRSTSTRRHVRSSPRSTPPPRTSARGLRPGTLVTLRDDAAGRHHPRPARPAPGAQAAACASGVDLFLAFSPERVSSGRVFADLARYPEARRRRRRGERAAGGRRSTAPACDFDERPDLARPERRVGPGLGRGGGAGEAGRDHLPRRQHRAGQPVRALRRPDRRRRRTG